VILVDTSVWIDHFRTDDATLRDLLEQRLVLCHPWVVGEIALGNLRRRDEIIGLLNRLPQATVAAPHEVLGLVERHALHGTGIGYVDAQLLAATRLTGDATLWTRDKRLREAARRLGISVGDGPPYAVD
jgi:predicted nucleic acid-binding protein